MKVAVVVSAFRIDFVFAEGLRGQDRWKLERGLLRRLTLKKSAAITMKKNTSKGSFVGKKGRKSKYGN